MQSATTVAETITATLLLKTTRIVKLCFLRAQWDREILPRKISFRPSRAAQCTHSISVLQDTHWILTVTDEPQAGLDLPREKETERFEATWTKHNAVACGTTYVATLNTI